jgi:hypothetical protein
MESGGDGGTHSHIALDSEDDAHIISVNRSLWMGIQYSTNASGSWVTTTFVERGTPTMISVDNAKRAHFVYGYFPTGSDTMELKYATNGSGSWSTETLDSGMGDDAFMDLDSLGKAHVAYNERASDELRYTTNASGSWVITTVDSGLGYGTGGNWGDLATVVDSADKVHISYNDAANQDLKYATNVSGSWTTETVDSAGSVGGRSFIAVDSADKVHISYCDKANDALKYATNASGTWVTTTLAYGLGYLSVSGTSADWSGPIEIALDGLDKVHIAYYDLTNDELKYLTNASGSWVTTTPASALGGYTEFQGGRVSLGLDSTDKAHVSYYDAAGRELKYVTNASGSWATEGVPSAGKVGDFNSIAVDSWDKVHISHAETSSGELRYTTDASGSWVTEALPSPEGVNGPTWLSVDGSGKVHISYWGSSGLQYVTNASGAWVTESAPSAGYGGYSFAVDNSGKVHISYISPYHECPFPDLLAQCNDLVYLTNASGSWVTSIVDTGKLSLLPPGEITILNGTAIAVDSANKVHMAYTKGETLKHTTNALGFWLMTDIDSYVLGEWLSIAVDSSDKVHMLYIIPELTWGFTISYATNASGSMEKTAALFTNDPDAMVLLDDRSMAVDGAGKAHIGYNYGVAGLGSWYFKYGTNTAGSWFTTTVHIGGQYSIAVTSQGSVRISHYSDDGTLRLTSSSPCVDGDGDGYGDPETPECPNPAWDCDDTDPGLPSGVPEGPLEDPTCSDMLDNDCDGDVDEEDSGCCVCMDADEDGYGDPACVNCDYPEVDCDDSDPLKSPGADEICNGIDDNCDGAIDDADMDMFIAEACGGDDCDDSNFMVNPHMTENCTNGIDDDCDNLTDGHDPWCAQEDWAIPLAQASVYGSRSREESGVSNVLAMLLLPMGALLLLRTLRRKK